MRASCRSRWFPSIAVALDLLLTCVGGAFAATFDPATEVGGPPPPTDVFDPKEDYLEARARIEFRREAYGKEEQKQSIRLDRARRAYRDLTL